MRENEEDWGNQLETVTNELIGMNKLFSLKMNYIVLLSKLLGLQEQETDFMFYRKTIFESITLLRGLI